MSSAPPAPDARPRYRQIAALVLREILSGRLRDGTRLPPERDMAAEMGVSVGTLRKALEALEGDGLLERVHGSGNYVTAPAELSGLYAFFRLERTGGGGVPDARALSVQRRMPPPDLPVLHTPGAAFRIRRERRLDGLPVAAEEIWLDGGAADDIALGDLGPSLYGFYRERLGLWIARARDSVGLGQMPGWSTIGGPGATCGFVERSSWDMEGRRVEVSRTWFDAARATYVNRME